jgi:hypothetical protein
MNTLLLRGLIAAAALATTSAWATDAQRPLTAPSPDCAARKAGGKGQDPYLKIELKEVMVSSRATAPTTSSCDYAIKEQGVRAPIEQGAKTGHVTLMK